MLLTIGIPTYNRASTLHKTLDNIASQIENAGLKNVDIVISDNCSTDETPHVCREISTKYPDIPIHYSRNNENIGFDRNVAKLFQLSKSTYVWTLSDDDNLLKSAIVEIYEHLKAENINFAFINYEIQIENQIFESRYGAGPTLLIQGKELLKKIKFSNSLISSSIFNRKEWIESNHKKYIGSQWIHFFVAREILPNGTGLIIGKKLIKMTQSGLEKSRTEKRTEKSDEIEFYMQAHLKFVQYASEMIHFGYDVETCTLANTLAQSDEIYQVINYKLTAPTYSLKQIAKTWQRLAHYRLRSLQFWAITTPLLFAPNILIKIMRTVYREVRRWG